MLPARRRLSSTTLPLPRRGPHVPGRSALAQAAAESLAPRIRHGRHRRCAGSHLGRAPRLRLDDRANRDRRGHRAEDVRRVLRAGAAGARVRPGRQPGRPLGRPRRRATTGRCRRAASPSTRKGTSGSPRPPAIPGSRPAAEAAQRGARPPRTATPRRSRRGRRRSGPRRGRRDDRRTRTSSSSRATDEFLLQIGKAGTPGGNDSTTALNRPAGVDVDAAATRSTSPTASSTTASSSSTPRPAPTSATGARTARRRTMRLPARTIRRTAGEAVQDRELREGREGRHGLRLRSRQQSRPGPSDKDGKFVKEASSRRRRRGDGSVWDIAFSKDPQQRFLFVADGHDQKDLRPSPRHARRGRQLRRRRPLPGARSTASAASRSTRRATSTRVKRSRANACRSSS